MIPVKLQLEPSHFDSKVRQPGQAFLSVCPSPHGKDWKNRNYWRKIHKDLYKRYSGLCAYTGMWFADISKSVDHFRPKSIYPHLAYEWSNYRLTTQKTNSNKSDIDNIIDPFLVQTGWFILEFPSCLIKAGNNVSKLERTQIEFTINILKLNDDDEYVNSRHEKITQYIDGTINFNDMNAKYPFIAYELQRQNLTNIAILKTIFKTFHQTSP
ncbi:MAG: hypothetical protein LBE18_12225 [Planctomycetaceae bacterium]|jgi:uncharacterized protein (TIGR02646 family)|nr:hypothetical protein [Planctomycetaceae bacterium]